MVRLQKVIAASGVASRRAAETMIREGHVTVNGKVVRVLGTCIDPSKDHVKIDGRHVQPSEPEVFVLLHKPPGYVTTMDDPYGRPTIADLMAKVKVRVFPVGRLDYDTEGLLLLTNNGNVAQACVHPRYHVPKTYLVKVSGVCTEEEIQNLEDGIALDDGMTAPAVIRKSGKAKANSWLEITIHEGRKHQIKRMLEALGHRVMRIIRIRFGPLDLGDLPVGVSRFATDLEANALRAIAQRTARPRSVRAQAPRSNLQNLKSARDTGPPRVRETKPSAKRDSSSKGSKARPFLRPARDTGPPRVRETKPSAKRDSSSKGSKARPSLRLARDTGPPRVRTTSPPAKKDSRSKGSKARPATKTRNVRAQAPRSDLQRSRPARDTGPPRVRTTNPPAKKDSRSKGSKARPAPGSARRPGRVVKGRGRPQTRKG